MVMSYPSMFPAPVFPARGISMPSPPVFDPEAQKWAMIAEALLAAGRGIGSQPTIGTGLAAGLAGAGEGALRGRQDYRTGLRERQQIAEDEQAAQQRAQQARLWASLFPTAGAPMTGTAATPAVPPRSGQLARADGIVSSGPYGLPDTSWQPPADAPRLPGAGAPSGPGSSLIAGMTPEQRAILAGMDPAQGMSLLAEQAFAKPTESWSPMSPQDEIAAFGHDAPGTYYASSTGGMPKLMEGTAPAGFKIETLDRGGNQEQGYFATPGDPKSWVSLGTAPRWQPPQAPSTVGVVTLQMPDGTYKSFANTNRAGIEAAISSGAFEPQGGGVSLSQQATNSEIDAARSRLSALGLTGPDLLAATQKTSDTGMPNENYNPQTAHDISLAAQHKTGDDPEFEQFQNLFGAPGPVSGGAPAPTFGQSGGDSAAGPIPAQAIDYLRQHPELRAAFDAKYGSGSSIRYLLGGR